MGQNNGTQTFSENQLSTNFIGWTNVVSGDFDNDGDIDIVTSESGSGSLSLIKIPALAAFLREVL